MRLPKSSPAVPVRHVGLTKGINGGPAPPHAAKVAQLRSVLPEDIRAVVEALVTEAKAGNVSAMREFFNRVLGQPQAIDAIERLAEVEAILERLEASPMGEPSR